MADLSAYSEISVHLDKKNSTITIADISNYPAGIAAGITGIVSIEQPDGITIDGSFSSPDITYTNGALTQAVIDLRLSSNGAMQNGTYVITYTARHASYDDTPYSKSFYLNYKKPTLLINDDFDVFSPSLKVNDLTSYVTNSLVLQDIERSWSAVIKNVGTVTGGDSSQFDIKYGGVYYDSTYRVTLTSDVTYELASDSTITITDRLQVSSSFETKVPASLNNLFSRLTNNKAKYNSKKYCGCDGDSKKQDYMYSYILFEHYKARGLCGDRSQLLDMLEELEDLLDKDCDKDNKKYTHSYQPIPAYDFNDFCGCCAGESSASTFTITTHPASQSVDAGGNVTFSVVASGGMTPYSYQLRKNGVAIGGATTTPYVLTAVDENDEGVYEYVVTDALGNKLLSNPATLQVDTVVVVTPPVITQHPQNVSINVGSTVNLSVTATGTGLSYQWRKDGVNISGATSSTYQVTNAQTGASGVYSVVVTNSAGSVTSNNATVTVTAVAQHQVNYGWRSGVVNAGNVASMTLDRSVTVNDGAASFIADFRTALGSYYFVVSEPATEPVKTSYYNTQFNNEAIPDFTFAAPVIVSGIRYYYTPDLRAFDPSATTTFST